MKSFVLGTSCVAMLIFVLYAFRNTQPVTDFHDWTESMLPKCRYGIGQEVTPVGTRQLAGIRYVARSRSAEVCSYQVQWQKSDGTMHYETFNEYELLLVNSHAR